MKRATSIYLDLVRFGAAVVVVLTHLAYGRFSGGLLQPLRTYGNDAVMIFFVLSGLVIAHTAAHRDRDPGSYFVNRCARLYSVALPAIILTIVLDQVGRQLDGALYDGFWYRDAQPLLRVLTALTFTNELWFSSWRLFTNGPYWSLGYEFWYYVLFAAGWFLRGGQRIGALLLLGLLVGPKILLLLPVWLLGVGVYRVLARGGVGPRLGATLFGGSLALYAAFRALGLRDVCLEWTYGWLGRRFVEGELVWSNEFVAAYFIGLLVAANFIGFDAMRGPLVRGLLHWERPIRAAAGCTFSIYLFHYPLLQFLMAALPLDNHAPAHIALLLALTLAACAGLAHYTEARKREARALVQVLAAGLGRTCRGLGWRG